MNENKLLGLKIKELRSKKSLEVGEKFTQKDLANAVGISRSYLGDIESGRTKPSDELIEKIATVLGVSGDYFFLENIKKQPTPIEKINTLVKQNKIETLAAHFNGEEFTDEDVEDIENFINYIISKKKN